MELDNPAPASTTQNAEPAIAEEVESILNGKIQLLPGYTSDLSAATYCLVQEDHTLGNCIRWMLMKEWVSSQSNGTNWRASRRVAAEKESSRGRKEGTTQRLQLHIIIGPYTNGSTSQYSHSSFAGNQYTGILRLWGFLNLLPFAHLSTLLSSRAIRFTYIPVWLRFWFYVLSLFAVSSPRVEFCGYRWVTFFLLLLLPLILLWTYAWLKHSLLSFLIFFR